MVIVVKTKYFEANAIWLHIFIYGFLVQFPTLSLGLKQSQHLGYKVTPKEVMHMQLFIGVKIRNLKVDFKTGGTWRRVGQ